MYTLQHAAASEAVCPQPIAAHFSFILFSHDLILYFCLFYIFFVYFCHIFHGIRSSDSGRTPRISSEVVEEEAAGILRKEVRFPGGHTLEVST